MPPEELSKTRLEEISPEFQMNLRRSSELITEKINAALSFQSPIFEWQIRIHPDQLIPCEVHLSRLPGAHRLVRATFIDITERKMQQKKKRKKKFPNSS